ncbi:alpha/beta hydrolase [Streptantibioticus silvisoli]|uniref:Alpha/beta hydrolase n=1 Tax=Streptantibioticus silvisoli TaxID=2705255 RepID=A0ABT6W6Q9_9ACTN|nr:alpha/beta hydrolase [Streptantibioticus silvisoli]MDI5966435.1 alpha/beta hydrolase [Streptantibioticus silvisoli]
MPLDPQIEILLQQLAAEAGPAPESRTVAENRAFGRAFTALAGVPEPIADVRDTAAAAGDRDIPLRVYRPVTGPDAGLLPVTLFFHGGGWVFGDLDTQDHIARTVAGRSGTIVVSVDYRLAPEHRFPAATDDAYAALTWVADNAAGFGGDAERIAVFGESAGGNLAAVLAQETLRRGGPRIALQVLAYPAVDRFDDSCSMYENATGPVLSRSYLEWFWGAYLSTPDQGADPRVSPARCDVPAGLPPAVIATAENDPLRDQGDRYARKLADAGVPVQHLPVEGAVHGFLSFTGSVRLSRDTLDRLSDAVAVAFA